MPQPPPITPPQLDAIGGFLSWIPTITLLTVVFAAGQLRQQIKVMETELKNMRKKVHSLSNALQRRRSRADEDEDEDDEENEGTGG